MTHEPLYAALRRQATYALTAFVCAAFALEKLIPGSVLPILDIVPIAIVAAGLLLYDATRRSRARRLPWVAPLIKLLFAAALLSILFFLTPWDGRAGMAAVLVMALGLASLAFWPEK